MGERVNSLQSGRRREPSALCYTLRPVLSSVSVLIPSDSSRAVVALACARTLAPSVLQVVVAGRRSRVMLRASRLFRARSHRESKRLQGECTVLIDAGVRATAADVDALCAPIEAGDADVVVPSPSGSPEARALNALARRVAGLEVRNPLAPIRAVRTEAHSVPPALWWAGVGRRAGGQARCPGLPVPGGPATSSMRVDQQSADWLALGRTLMKYALLHNDTDNTHEGYNTLVQMDQAPRYNAWLGRKLRPHLGQRVLEIGAGIGTITREIAPGRERVIALEADPFYVQRLRNLFRGSDVVQPVHAPVERTDWDALWPRSGWTR